MAQMVIFTRSDSQGYRLDDCFGELAMEQRPALQAIANQLVHDQNATEDIAQEAIAKVCSVLRREPIMSPKTYLKVSVNSVAADYLEHQIRSRESSLEALLEKDQLPSQLTEFSGPLDVVIHNEDVEEALTAINSLPARMGEAIRLRYLKDLDYETIAKQLGQSVNTIKSDVKRGKKRARKEILKARGAYSRDPK